jgi:Peptidase family M23.
MFSLLRKRIKSPILRFFLTPLGFWATVTTILAGALFVLVTAAFMLLTAQNDCANNPTVDVNATIQGSDGSVGGDWTVPGTVSYITAQQIFTYLIDKEGFTGAAAAGAVANAARETGRTFDPKIENKSGGVIGLFQWGGWAHTLNSDRIAKEGSIKKGDYSTLTVDNELKLVSFELNGGFRSFKEKIGVMSDPFAAAKLWTKIYEGVDPDNDKQADLVNLQKYAAQAYNQFDGASHTTSNISINGITAGSDADTSRDQHSLGAGCNIDDGKTSAYIFDKEENGFVLNDGIDGPGHGGKHDGWDINPINHPMNPDGQNIYAVLSGTVIKVQQGDQQTEMPLVEIKSKLNGQQVVVVYQEFKAKSVPDSVVEGATIQAGSKIGQMGSMFPDGHVNGALTNHGFVAIDSLGSLPAGATAVSIGNHLHISVKKYQKDSTNYPTWAADENTIDPGVLWGLGMGKESGSFTWDQQNSDDTENKGKSSNPDKKKGDNST